MSSVDRETFALAQEVLVEARSRSLKLGCAESCTGGLIAAALTEVPGSSDAFVGGIVSYWVEVKEAILRVDPEIIDACGVVSTQTAEAMARGARVALGCDIAIATTGIAGPTGALPGKPVGTVCFGLATPSTISSFVTCDGDERGQVRAIAVRTALAALLQAVREAR